jgi:hypothetical protein
MACAAAGSCRDGRMLALVLVQPLQLGIADAIADELLAGPPDSARRAPAGV